jgi:uncharacterized protein
MPPLSVMFKTVSTDCNLDCAYCYYRVSLWGSRQRHRLTLPVLERFLAEYMSYIADVKTAHLVWQGGEPTLAGLPFFETVVRLEAQYAPPGTVIANALQTNGVLLTDAWAAFLKTYNFLVGVSLDGPQPIHDTFRTYRNGRGSFVQVMRGIEHLRRHGVAFNILCVLGPHNIDHPRELLRFFRREGFSHVQFIPAMDFQATTPEAAPTYLITPEQYGRFLCEIFDEWYENGFPTISIRIFDNFLQNYLGMPAELCVHSDTCDAGIVVEHNGDLYPCDFYIHPAWRLGNIMERPLREILANPLRATFMRQKRPLPEACRRCPWLSVCRSGCPRNRWRTADGLAADHFCQAYTMLFTYADERLRALRDRLLRWQRYLVMVAAQPHLARATGPNAPCPCGSGLKHKKCCQRATAMRSYLFTAAPLAAPVLARGR